MDVVLLHANIDSENVVMFMECDSIPLKVVLVITY